MKGSISRGAGLARQELAADGIKIRLETVNTEAPDWLSRLSALPPECAVVGGPLQARNYAQARSAGAVDQRAFFTFLPSLEQGDEGARAWRFFPSPQDQIDRPAFLVQEHSAFHPRSPAYFKGHSHGRQQPLVFRQGHGERGVSRRELRHERAHL